MEQKKIKASVHTSYLDCIYTPDRFPDTVRQTVSRLRQMRRTQRYRFDAIAFRGSSGAAVAYPAAAALGCGLIHVRKSLGHHHQTVEGLMPVERYIIVDDFVSEGTTIRRIIEEINRAHEEAPSWYHGPWPKPKLTAVLLYRASPSSYKTRRCHYSESRIGDTALKGAPVFSVSR